MIETKDKEYVPKDELEGKTIKEFESGVEEITILFEDGTYHNIMTGAYGPDI